MTMRGAAQLWRFITSALIAAAFLVTLPESLRAQNGRPIGQERANVLLLASEPTQVSADWLAGYLSDEFDVNVTIIGPDGYAPRIDEEYYDGFVYLGNHYYQTPGAGFVADIAATEKPVLWLNYHAWLLPIEVQEELGMRFADAHSLDFTRVNFFGMRPLSSTDTSEVTVTYPARSLYWLFTDDFSRALPGAAVSDNVVYISYLPAFLPDQPDIVPFHTAAKAAFSEIAPAAPAKPGAAERLADMRNDNFRTSFHLPFAAGSQQVIVPPRYDSSELHDNLFRIRDIGAEAVIIHQTYFQMGKTGSEPLPDPVATASFDELTNIARDAHKLGLGVRLAVIVNLAEEGRKPGDWRGHIWPRDPDKWWTRYREIILDAARFARENDIEALTIGAELSRLEAEEDQWRALIDAVRNEAGFQNLIGYQTNFDRVTDFTWGDALDYLAVAAYWPLAERRDEPLENLMASWDRIRAELDPWIAENPDVSLEFGEVGYASQPYAAVFPFSWKPHRGRQLSLEEQETSYLSLEYMLRNVPGIAGIGIFASTAEDHVPENIGYSPFGKPAENVIRRIMTLR